MQKRPITSRCQAYKFTDRIRHFVSSRHIGFAADQYAHASTGRVLLARNMESSADGDLVSDSFAIKIRL